MATISYPPPPPERSDKAQKEAAEGSFEFDYTPPKGSFFLYTIHEHQMLTNKTFGYKKKLYNSFLSGNLSKSDSNICKGLGTDNKSFI